MTRSSDEPMTWLLLALLALVIGGAAWFQTDSRCARYGDGWGASHVHRHLCQGPDGELRGVPPGC